MIPSGLPAWSRTAEISSYGGSPDKANYMAQGATNPVTDLTAEEHARMVADLASAVRTAPFATLTVNDANVGADPTVAFATTMATGPATGDYPGGSPPLGFPAVTRDGDGEFTVTLPADATDDYGVTEPLVLRHITAGLGGSTPGFCAVEILTPSTAKVRVWDTSGALVAGRVFALRVW